MVNIGTVIPGELIDRVLQCGFSTIKCAIHFNKRVKTDQTESGVVDTLRSLLMHEHFIKPYSEEQIMTALLPRAFQCVVYAPVCNMIVFPNTGNFNESK